MNNYVTSVFLAFDQLRVWVCYYCITGTQTPFVYIFIYMYACI